MNTMTTVLRRSLVLLLLVVSGLSTSGQAETFGDFTYTTNDVSAAITKYIGNGGNVTIPDAIEGKPVTSIATYAFRYCTNLTGITIPDSVTNIGYYAFAGCASLLNVSIPNGVRNLGFCMFADCSSLTNIDIPASIINIGVNTFSGCTSLKTISVDPLNTAYSSIDGVLFDKSRTGLCQFPPENSAIYVIPEGVTNIWGAAFYGSSKLESVTMPGSVTRLGTISFYGCTNLTNVVMSENITALSSNVFANCIGLTDIIIPSHAANIGYGAFSGCTRLTNVTMSSSVKKIENNAFAKCSSLTGITIPNSVYAISDSSFNDCASLTSLYFQGGAPLLPWTNARFNINNKYVTVYYNVGTSDWGATYGGLLTAPISNPDVRGFAFEQRDTTIAVTDYAGPVGAVVIPDTIAGMPVTVIGIGAFSNNTNLTEITIPSGVTNFEINTFSACFNLTRAFFKGNAPIFASTPFYSDRYLTVYYRAGTTGWGATLGDHPTALWVEQPTYQEWAQRVGLLDKFPDASAETDDADHDGMTNLAEMQAGTDPTTPNSKLAFESAARINDLADGDKTAVGPGQHALYFQTVPGKKYELQSATAIAGVWQTETNITATTTQKRVLVSKPVNQGFYRLILVP